MKTGRRLSPAVAGLFLSGTLLISACGSSDAADSADDGSGGAATSSSYYSPLNEYMSPSGMAEYNEEDAIAQNREVEELVATCMKDQGFDYIPNDANYGSASYFGDSGDENLSERDRIAKYGYWITTQPEQMAQPSEIVDPNQEMLDGMSESELMAYQVALYGTGITMGMESSSSAAPASSSSGSGSSSSESASGTDGAGTDAASTDAASTDAASTDAASTDAASADAASTDAASTDAAGSEGAESEGDGGAPISIGEGDPGMAESYAQPSTPEEKGCYGVASEEVYKDQPGANVNYEDFQDLFDAQNELYMNLDKDPRLAEAVTAWSTCLEGKGFPGFTEMQAPSNDVQRKWAELNNQVFEEMEGGGYSIGPKPGTENDPPTVPDPAKVAELKKYEIELALADYDCKGDYTKLYDEVRIALEEQFIEDHKAELERYRDAINSGGN